MGVAAQKYFELYPSVDALAAFDITASFLIEKGSENANGASSDEKDT